MRLPCGKQRLGVRIFDPPVRHQHRVAGFLVQRAVELQRERSIGGESDIACVDAARRRGDPVHGRERACHVVACVAGDANRQPLLAEEARLAARFGRRNRLALVDDELQAGRKIVRDEACRIDVGDLLHRLRDLQFVAAASGSEQPVGHSDALARTRLVVHAGLGRRSHAAEDVGDEREMPAIEREEHWTARQLPLPLLDEPRAAWRQRELRLKDAVRPRNRHEIDLQRAARTEGEGLEALAEARLLTVRGDSGPPRVGARRNGRADSRRIRPYLRAGTVAPGERHRHERKTAGARPPDPWGRVAAGRQRDDRRSARRIQQHERPAGDRWSLFDEERRGLAAFVDRQRLPRSVLPRADQIESSVAVDVRERELRAAGEARRAVDRRRLPRTGSCPRPTRDAVEGARIKQRMRAGIQVARDGRGDRRLCEPAERRVAMIAPRAVVDQHVVRRRRSDRDDVHVPIAVDVGDDDARRGTAIARETDCGAERPKRTIAVVVE